MATKLNVDALDGDWGFDQGMDPRLLEERTALISILNDLNIPFTPFAHAPASTADDLDAAMAEEVARGSLPCKNLFVRAKKVGNLALIVAKTDTAIDLKAMTALAGLTPPAKKMYRLAPDDILLETLKVLQGSVNPFALRHAVGASPDAAQSVVLWIEAALLADDDNSLLFHPMANSASVAIRAGDLKRYFAAQNIEFREFDPQSSS